MSVVLDCSATLAWCFEDEASAAIDRIFDDIGRSHACVPTLWHLEVANGLQTAVRRGRLDVDKRNQMLTILSVLDIRVDPHTDRQAWTKTLNLADQFQLTVYDAAYLELAQRLTLPLATLDRALRQAALSAHVSVLGH